MNMDLTKDEDLITNLHKHININICTSIIYLSRILWDPEAVGSLPTDPDEYFRDSFIQVY